ncbi:MAG: PKD-like domain-containing protein, partial [Bacteroidia bacterium]
VSYQYVDQSGNPSPVCSFMAKVNPKPSAPAITIIVCDNDSLGFDLQDHIDQLGNGVNSTFTWKSNGVAGVLGNSTTWQTGPIITDRVENITLLRKSIVYSVRPTSSPEGCSGDVFRVIVRIDPSSNLTALPSNICKGERVNLASLVRDYTMLATGVTFYNGDPAAGGQVIGSAAMSRGLISSRTKIMVRPRRTKTYWALGTTANGCTQAIPLVVNVSTGCSVYPSITVKLQGAYDASTQNMRTTLNQAQLIPSQEPYTGLGYTFVGGGSEQMTTTAQQNQDVVDWVLVELRDSVSPNIVVHSRAALLLKDGRIVDVNGVDDVQINIANTVSYFVAIIHRNHLGLMTANPIQPGVAVDFSDPSLVVYGGINAREIRNGSALMFAGDADGNGQVQNVDDALLWRPFAGQSGYKGADYNLDGQVQNSDRVLIWTRNVGRGTNIPR